MRRSVSWVTMRSGYKFQFGVLRGEIMKDTVILVHGAFADGSSWGRVISTLEKDGYNVIAVQNPLTSYADDVATTRRVIDAQQGSVVLVGHSYGGAVITKAAAGAPNVRALVYIAAFGPDEGENLQALLEQYPSKIGGSLVPDAAGVPLHRQDQICGSLCSGRFRPRPECDVSVAEAHQLTDFRSVIRSAGVERHSELVLDRHGRPGNQSRFTARLRGANESNS